jgi:uncharacterized membrane protein YccC
MASGGDHLTSLADHPRAAPSIRRAKALGGLAGFGLAVLVGVQNGEPFSPMLLRALELGLAGNLVAWAAAVVVWKRVLAAQATATVRELQERRAAATAETAE